MATLQSNTLNSAALRLTCVALLLCATVAFAQSRPNKANKVVKGQSPYDGLFHGDNVLRLKLEISEKDIETLKNQQWTFGQQTERSKVQATVREGNTVYTNVSVQLKGAAGSFRAIDDKPAFTLHFEKLAEGQRFHDLKKLSLNNSVQDATYIHEQFSRELYLKAGVPVPRAAHARVELNGRDLGLYVLVEGWDKEFLKRHFKKTKGNLYDGGFVKDVTDELGTNSGEDPKDQSDRKALAEAASEPDLATRAERLAKLLDMDRFTTLLALEVMLWNWDGYPMNKNNWRLYHDMDKDKMVFMPHGMDQMFWKPEGSILPTFNGLVAKSVMEIPAYRDRYFARMKELRKTLFNERDMTNRVIEIDAKVRPALAEADSKAVKEHDIAVGALNRAIVQRATSLDRQLAKPIEPLKFNEAGYANLTGWELKSDFGRPTFTPSTGVGKGIVQVATREGSSIGSWRTSAWLERGAYTLSGRIKTKGLTADPGDSRAGAGFRLKNARPDDYVTGDSDWKSLEIDFHVGESLGELQFVGEFRGLEGEAWFDLESVRIHKEKDRRNK